MHVVDAWLPSVHGVVRWVTRDDDSERTGSSATRDASTPSNRRIPEPNSTGESAIENSSIRPAFTYSRIVAPPPAMRTSRSPAAPSIPRGTQAR